MTQPMSQDVQVHLNGMAVTSYLPHIQQRETAALQNFQACKDVVLEAAELYAEEKDDDKLTKLRDQLLRLVEFEHKIKAHTTAVARVGQQYIPSLEKSDFGRLIDQHLQSLQGSIHPERDECVRDFDQIVGKDTAEQEEDLDDDEDLVITGGAVERNERCPITMKLLIELKEPVEDDKGFVYEAEAIKQSIRAGGGAIECPVAGARHIIRVTSLKPCRRVIRMQKAQKRGATQAGQGQQAQHGVVLDV